MIGSSENRISYNGNGIATEFAYAFKILEKSDMKVLHVAADGTETLLVSDYYVDMEKSVVLYPGYAPGAEIPEQNRPPILPVGERLVLYREVPITQESALDKHWPFNVIENGLDKLTIICQQIWDRLQRSFYVSESTSSNFDPKVPIEAGKTFRVKDDGTGFEVTEDPGKVIDGAKALLKQTTEQAESANEQAVNAQNAATSVQKYKALWFDSVASMKAEPSLTAGAYVCTAGYYTPNDGGGASYLIRAKADSDTVDNGSLHDLANGLVAELLIENSTVCPEQFGAVGDGSKSDKVAFEFMFSFVSAYYKQYNQEDKVALPIICKGVYDVDGLEINYPVQTINIIGGHFVGLISFLDSSFYNLYFTNCNFSNNSTSLYLSPNSTKEFKNVHFLNCRFNRQLEAIICNTQSINVRFTNCIFKWCDVVFDGTNIDMATFSNCWFDFAQTKTKTYVIRNSGDNAGQYNFENCIIVNAATDIGEMPFISLIETSRRVAFNMCRISNEGGTHFRLVRFTEATLPVSSRGHHSSCTFNQCYTNCEALVHLDGIPNQVVVNACSGSTGGAKLITINDAIEDPYSLNPNFKIFLSNNHYGALFFGATGGNNGNEDGITAPVEYRPSIPHSLKYAINRGYNSQTLPQIKPLIIDFAYNANISEGVDLFSITFKGQAVGYNTLVPPIWVRYVSTTVSTYEKIPTMDILTLQTDKSNVTTITKTTLYGDGDTSYSISNIVLGEPVVFKMLSSKRISAIDYGFVSNGYNSIGQC